MKCALIDTLMRHYRLRTDTDVAKFLGTSITTISMIRSGARRPSAEFVLAVYDQTDWSIEQIRQLLDLPQRAPKENGNENLHRAA